MMFLVISDQKVPWQVIERSSITSRHTGRELQQLTVKLYISDPTIQEELEENILGSKDKEISSFDPTSDTSQTWTISNNSYRYSDGDPIRYYTLELTEKDSYELTKLIIDDTEIEPYLYSEYFNENRLVIETKVTISGPDEAKLCQLLKEKLKENGYFQVKRIGINENPVEMRFGRVIWSQNDKEKKFSLILVAKNDDGKEDPALFYYYDIAIDNTIIQLTETKQILNKLIKKLTEKDVLSGEEAEEILKVDVDDARLAELQFIRCPDIDKVIYKKKRT